MEEVKMTFFFKSKKVKDSLLFAKSDYLFEEDSFLNNAPHDASLMVNHQYLSLDINLKNNLITGVSGYFNLLKCSKKALELLKGEAGMVEVFSNSFTLESGIGYIYPLVGGAFFDKEKGILQIGEVRSSKTHIKISDNIIICLFEEEITCIQIKVG